jgi:hypothetical protein
MTAKAGIKARHSGKGAIPHARGVIFRGWAPHAEGSGGLPCSGEIGIEPYAVVIFSQDE